MHAVLFALFFLPPAGPHDQFIVDLEPFVNRSIAKGTARRPNRPFNSDSPAKSDSSQDSYNPIIDTRSDGDSAEEPLRPGEWDRTHTLQERVELASFYHHLAQRIDAALVYRDEILASRLEGLVRVAVSLKRDGQLAKIQLFPSSANDALKGWVVTTVTRALSRPLINEASTNDVQALLEFNFRITHPTVTRVARQTVIFGNTLRFDREGQIPAKYDLSIHSADDNIFTRLFRTKDLDGGRMNWDLLYKLKLAQSTCETQLESGACFEAGKISQTLGRTREAAKWMRRACDEKSEDACKWLTEQ